MRPGLGTFFVIVKNDVQNPGLHILKALFIVAIVTGALFPEPSQRVGMKLGNGAEPDVTHGGKVPAHAHNKVHSLERILKRRDNERSAAASANLKQGASVGLDVGDAADGHALVSLAFLNGLFLFALSDAVHGGAHLGLCIEGVDEETLLQMIQVVHEGRLEHLALSVIELTLAVHHAHLPAALVRVVQLLLRSALIGELLGPNELSVAVELTEEEVAAVLAATRGDKVAVAVTCTEVPLAGVL